MYKRREEEFKMGLVELFLIAVGLSMDAFAVSITDGIVMKNRRRGVLAALLFGLFQAGMPVAGYFLGSAFAEFISRYDHYIALVVLGFIGGKMIYESIGELRAEKSGEVSDSVKEPSFGGLIMQAIATSIDALVVGVSFAALKTSILPAALFIGVVTFVICIAGFFGGRKFGQLFGAKASILGGAVLVCIGLKTFIEHTFFAG